MSFEIAARSALAKIYDPDVGFGDEAIFSPLFGGDVSLNVIIDADNGYQPGGTVQVSNPVTTISYQRADIDRKVVRDETFTVDGAIYTVRGMANYPDSWTEFEGRCVVSSAD